MWVVSVAGQVYNASVMCCSQTTLRWAAWSSCTFLCDKFFFLCKVIFFSYKSQLFWKLSSKTFDNTGCSCTVLLLVWLEEELHRLAPCCQSRRSICPLEPEKNNCTMVDTFFAFLRLLVSPPHHPQHVPGCKAELVAARDPQLLAAPLSPVGDHALHVGSILGRLVRLKSVAFSFLY